MSVGAAVRQGADTHSGEEPILAARDLTVTFTQRRGGRWGRPVRIEAVDGVSLGLLAGETIGLVGESGSGKSTLARALLGLRRPTSGSVRFEGRDLATLDGAGRRAFRQRVQIVFQDPYGSLNPRLAVGAAIEEVLEVHRLVDGRAVRRARVAELLDEVGLHAGHADRYPHELSGGQRQRFGIARALAVRPEVLVLDEPVSALDVSVRAQVVNLLVDLQERRGLTYLFIAHDLALVRHLADRVAVMKGGRIVEAGNAAQIFQNPMDPYTRTLLAAIPGGRTTGVGPRGEPEGPERREPPSHAASGPL